MTRTDSDEVVCYHCGQAPDPDGDHSCPCPNADGLCPEHDKAPDTIEELT